MLCLKPDWLGMTDEEIEKAIKEAGCFDLKVETPYGPAWWAFYDFPRFVEDTRETFNEGHKYCWEENAFFFPKLTLAAIKETLESIDFKTFKATNTLVS